MTKKGSIAAVLFVLIVGIVGAVFLYGGGSSETGAMLLENGESPPAKVTLCHETITGKYNEISVSADAVAAHIPGHFGDKYPPCPIT